MKTLLLQSNAVLLLTLPGVTLARVHETHLYKSVRTRKTKVREIGKLRRWHVATRDLSYEGVAGRIV
jgi:hypothetical protein